MSAPTAPTRLLHLSDLHFGAQAPGAAEALLEAVRQLAPTLIVVTGDLTQRARNSQFAAARRFFDELPGEWLAVPGNHDLPLFRPWHRLLRPRGRYRRHIADVTTAHVDLHGLRIALLDSTDALAWRAGRLRSEVVDDAAAWLSGSPGAQLRIAAAHHPFAARARGNKGGMRGGVRAAQVLIERGGADLLLWGHLHRSEVGLIATPSGRRALGIGVGSATSVRQAAEGFLFHALDLTPDHAHLMLWRRLANEPAFHPLATHRFAKSVNGWQAA